MIDLLMVWLPVILMLLGAGKLLVPKLVPFIKKKHALVFFLVGLLWYAYNSGWLMGLVPGTIPDGSGFLPPGGCDTNCETSPSVLWTAENQYTFVTTDTTASAVSYYSGGIKKAGTPGTAVTTIAPCSQITYYGYVDSTTNYGVHGKSMTVQCGNTEVPLDYWTIATYTDASNYVKNEDGTVNSASNTETISAGEVDVLEICWTGDYETAYGHPDWGNVLVIDLVNSTRVDDITSSQMEKVSVPDQVTVAANHKYFAFKFPSLMSSETVCKSFVFDADDTYGYGTDNMTLTLYDGQQYHDGNDNTIKFGVEDENDASIGLATHDTATIYTS